MLNILITKNNVQKLEDENKDKLHKINMSAIYPE